MVDILSTLNQRHLDLGQNFQLHVRLCDLRAFLPIKTVMTGYINEGMMVFAVHLII